MECPTSFLFLPLIALILIPISCNGTSFDSEPSVIPMPFITGAHLPHAPCSHIPPEPGDINHVSLGIETASHSLRSKRSVFQPLRIKVHYDPSVFNLPPDKLRVINESVLPVALDYWGRALRVKPLQVPIRLSPKCHQNKAYFMQVDGHTHQYCVDKCSLITTCGEVTVPQTHLEVCRSCSNDSKTCNVSDVAERGDGIKDADFIFYVSSTQTSRCNKGSTVAYAAHCQQESGLDRPIAGHANLCPDSISTKAQDLDTLIATMKHEILHALGFSVSLYSYFRDPNGKPLTPRASNGRPPMKDPNSSLPNWGENVIQRVVRNRWKVRSGYIKKEVHVIVTPRVKAEVRSHFNCPHLEGAELEDQGEDGTLWTHWEKRLFENEAMTGTHTQNPVYSRITLALMEDTGWYRPDYTLAQSLKWGKNLGCDFAMKSCKEWMDEKRLKKQSIHPFCDKVKRDPLETECTDSRESVALCNLMEYPVDLGAQFQNFDHLEGMKDRDMSRMGGSVNLADYCPYIQEFTWKSNEVVVRGSQCSFQENNPIGDKNFALESYGPQSKCFNHDKNMWEERTCHQIRQWQHWGSGCYQFACTDGRIHLMVANHTYTCFYKGQKLKVQLFHNEWLHMGTIVCPSCNSVCQASNSTFKCAQDVIKSHALQDKMYHKDFLKCSSHTINGSSVWIMVFTTVVMWWKP